MAYRSTAMSIDRILSLEPIKPPPCPNPKKYCDTCGAQLEYSECEYCGNTY